MANGHPFCFQALRQDQVECLTTQLKMSVTAQMLIRNDVGKVLQRRGAKQRPGTVFAAVCQQYALPGVGQQILFQPRFLFRRRGDPLLQTPGITADKSNIRVDIPQQSATMFADTGLAGIINPPADGCVHMNIALLKDGSLLALYRSRWADHIYLSRSFDRGESWSVPQPTDLPNNNSSIQVTTLANGDLALVFNAMSAEGASERRLSLYDEIEAIYSSCFLLLIELSTDDNSKMSPLILHKNAAY